MNAMRNVPTGRTGLIFAAILLALVTSHASAQVQDRSLGPVSITGDQVLYIHVLSLFPATPPSPVQAAITVFNAGGEPIANAGGVCEGLCPPALLSLESGKVTTVSIAGASLGLGQTDSLTIQPVISVFGPGFSHLLTTIDVIGLTSPFRGGILIAPIVVSSTQLPITKTGLLGPIYLQAGEYARLTATMPSRMFRTDTTLFFLKGTSAERFNETSFQLDTLESASIELQGGPESIVILGGVTFEDGYLLEGGRRLTLEIIDAATNAVKVTLSNGQSLNNFSSGSSGGGN